MNSIRWNMLLAALTLGVAPFYSVADTDVYRYAVEVNAKRSEGLLLKYTRFNSESPYPCLRLELINPKDDWTVVERKNICEMNGLSLANDFSYAGFSKIEFHGSAVGFDFNYLLNEEPGEYVQRCTVEAKGRILSEMKCTDPQRTN
ncbi:hypothetical protein [Stutzerimonas xanthomarina]|uniref:hypothetical protein n=1 Tax=Stutzerimonas xanthomarina TaxID=271420 RepID=UPI0029A138F4|nr:hypothetical protein [Stutzerimonas xanthomarina]MDX2355023.1 hypothetical protein [Stutzerimonas xanthomarina]|tara:strand:- start:623 stop:1060 length:438 start_codon:yes stop_codon:yes gene_type:complete